MQILSGQKIGLKLLSDDTCAQFKPHLESLHLLEARISDWLDYLIHFKNWEYFIPNIHVAGIKYEASLPKEDRSYTGFDNKFFISVLKSIDEVKYNQVI